ncbi:MAG TPA: hypothetical protein VFH31_15055 [Pyrinomonadaceae bacterium]|nr:hypothetical protein [Pyrinomonadaceae bacterium]
MRKLMIVALASALAAAALTAPNFDKTTRASNFPVIDGSVSPEKIPDRIAYSLMLRLISSGRNESEKRHLKSYVARIGLTSDVDAQALFSAAEEYQRRVNSLDARVKAIKEQEKRDQATRSPQTQRLLEQVQSEYDVITDEIVNSFSARLSKDGQATLQRFMDHKFKKNVKLRPSVNSAS